MGRGSSPNRDPSHHALALPPSHVYTFSPFAHQLGSRSTILIHTSGAARCRKPDSRSSWVGIVTPIDPTPGHHTFPPPAISVYAFSPFAHQLGSLLRPVPEPPLSKTDSISIYALTTGSLTNWRATARASSSTFITSWMLEQLLEDT